MKQEYDTAKALQKLIFYAGQIMFVELQNCSELSSVLLGMWLSTSRTIAALSFFTI